MSFKTTAGQLVVNHALPEDLQNQTRILNKAGMEELLQEVGQKYPDKYREIAHELSRIGHHTAYMSGGNTFSLAHMKKSLAGKLAEYKIETEVNKIYSDDKLSDKEKEVRVIELLHDHNKPLEEKNYRESLAEHNPFAMQVLSGARGNAMNLKSLRAGDLMYVDHKDDPIAIPVTRSYSEGLTPVQYYAGTFGARKGVLDTKLSVQNAGFISKQFNQISHRLIVAAHDADEQPQVTRGFPVATDDPDNEGALLAHPAGGYIRNTLLTPRILSDIKNKSIDELLVRSPTVGGHPSGGVYARDVGVRERGGLAPIGDFVGIAASQALAEPLTQSGLSSKHSGGVAGASHALSGFALVNCLAAGTEVRMADGSVRAIEDIQLGETVLGADSDGQTLAVRVSNVFRNGSRPCHRTEFRRGRSDEILSLVSTLDHKILATRAMTVKKKSSWIRPGQFPVGLKTSYPFSAYLAGERGRANRTKQIYVGELPTYDIEVDHADHLFVLANGLIVSNSLVQVPKTFRNGATHTQVDGRVRDVWAAPQGGTYVTVEGQQHHVPHGADVFVKPGDEVEAGDVMSSGIPNPAEVTEHKGIGEGRRYFVEAMRKAYKDSGMPVHRRNLELLARGLIDHVRVTEEFGDHLPDDVVPYSRLEQLYKPRHDSTIEAPSRAIGKHLEEPVLHYSIGTKIRPGVVKRMHAFDIGQIKVHPEPPPFQPEMIRGMESLSQDPDWMTRFLGSYLQKNMLRAVHRSETSDESGTSYVPALAHGAPFGKTEMTKGWDSKSPLEQS